MGRPKIILVPGDGIKRDPERENFALPPIASRHPVRGCEHSCLPGIPQAEVESDRI